MVDFVVATHGHPDHNGNAHEFPDSVHYIGNFVHHRTKFNFSSLYQVQIFPNKKLFHLLEYPPYFDIKRFSHQNSGAYIRRHYGHGP